MSRPFFVLAALTLGFALPARAEVIDSQPGGFASRHVVTIQAPREKVYATLTEAAQHETLDLVNVFRNAEDVPPVVDEAIALGVPALWLQLGITHEAAAAKARAAGLHVVQNKCLKVEHSLHT